MKARKEYETELAEIKARLVSLAFERERIARQLAPGGSLEQGMGIYHVRAKNPLTRASLDKLERNGASYGLTLDQVVDYNRPSMVEKEMAEFRERELDIRNGLGYWFSRVIDGVLNFGETRSA